MELHFMKGTTAIHPKVGDISRAEGDPREEDRLCIVHPDDKGGFVGNWIYGFCLANVSFPADTTRELRPWEKDRPDLNVFEGTELVGVVQVREGAVPDERLFLKGDRPKRRSLFVQTR